MKSVKNDIAGMKFKSLTVTDKYIQVGQPPNRKTKWLCVCDCGNELWVYRDALIRRKVDYCDRCRNTGVRNTKLYHIYHGMLQRCYNKNNPNYIHYGNKGIKVYDAWRDNYQNFYDWSMQNGYKEGCGLSIDRLDINKDYCPDNCEWVSLSENSRRGNLGKVKNHSKLDYIYAISPAGDKIVISNIAKFSRDYNLNYSTVNAAIRNRGSNLVKGYLFHSNLTD